MLLLLILKTASLYQIPTVPSTQKTSVKDVNHMLSVFNRSLLLNAFP